MNDNGSCLTWNGWPNGVAAFGMTEAYQVQQNGSR